MVATALTADSAARRSPGRDEPGVTRAYAGRGSRVMRDASGRHPKRTGA
jgi:hypothetical protein